MQIRKGRSPSIHFSVLHTAQRRYVLGKCFWQGVPRTFYRRHGLLENRIPKITEQNIMKIPNANRYFHDPTLSLEWIKDTFNLITQTHSEILFIYSKFRLVQNLTQVKNEVRRLLSFLGLPIKVFENNKGYKGSCITIKVLALIYSGNMLIVYTYLSFSQQEKLFSVTQFPRCRSVSDRRLSSMLSLIMKHTAVCGKYMYKQLAISFTFQTCGKKYSVLIFYRHFFSDVLSPCSSIECISISPENIR